MFLTGFDATTLNTLWVDKSLRAHGLIQAYSRTNRILNSVKTYGNIVTFRDLEQETNDAIALFGNKDAARHRPAQAVRRLLRRVRRARSPSCSTRFPLGRADRRRERRRRTFIALFGAILRLQNILTVVRRVRRQRDPHRARRARTTAASTSTSTPSSAAGDDAEKESINDDVVFEIELIKQVEINVDYILMLVEKYREERGDGADNEIDALAKIRRAIDSSLSLRNKKDLIVAFVDSVSRRLGRRRGLAPLRRGQARRGARRRSSPTRASSPTRPARSSRAPSATARSRRPARRSPRSCRRSPASPPTAATRARSRPCSTSSQRSSTGSSGWAKRETAQVVELEGLHAPSPGGFVLCTEGPSGKTVGEIVQTRRCT